MNSGTQYDILNQTLISANNTGWTPLHTVTRYQPAKSFIALIELIKKMHSDTQHDILNQTLVSKDNDGWTPLHAAARYQPAESFLALMRLIATINSDNLLNQTLVLVNMTGWTPLHIAAYYQASESFDWLIQMTNIDTLSDAIVKKNQLNQTILDLSIRRQNKKSNWLLLGKIRKGALERTITDSDNLAYLLKYLFKTLQVFDALMTQDYPLYLSSSPFVTDWDCGSLQTHLYAPQLACADAASPLEIPEVHRLSNKIIHAIQLSSASNNQIQRLSIQMLSEKKSIRKRMRK